MGLRLAPPLRREGASPRATLALVLFSLDGLAEMSYNSRHGREHGGQGHGR